MFTKFTLMTSALALGIAGMVFSAQPAAAGANEYFKCSLAEGKTMDDLVAIGSDFHAVLAEAGIEGFWVSFMTPLFAPDIKRGTFYWVGHAPDVATIGAINDLWDTDVNKDVRDAWEAATSDCESSSVYITTKVE